MNDICQGCLSLFADGCHSRVFLCFSLFVHTRDAELTVARNAQSPFVCARDTSVRCVQGSSQFAFWWFLVEPDVSLHLNPNMTDCVRVQRSVISIVNWLVRDSSSFITSPRVIVNQTPSARVIIVFDNYLLSKFDNKNCLKVVAEQELQSTECLERKDRILRELI